jgi:hypothetical protein
LAQKTQSLLKEVAGLLCLDPRINDRKAMQSSGILDFPPQKPDYLRGMKAKSEFPPFLPPDPLKPGRTDAPIKSLNKQIPISFVIHNESGLKP